MHDPDRLPRILTERHVVAIGGSTRGGSSTERVLRTALDRCERRGATTQLFSGQALVLPPYEPGAPLTHQARVLVESVRRADAVILGSPGYHGSVSGLVKNAIDYIEELRDDDRPYLDGRVVGCVATAYGAQAAVNTLASLRQIVHALRGWPTPYGMALDMSPATQARSGPDEASLSSVELMVSQLFVSPEPISSPAQLSAASA